MTINPGDLGIDYSGARPAPSDIVKNKGKFILRYSAGIANDPKVSNATQWKLCGVNEIRDAVAAGLDFVANSEWYEGRITEGAAAGAADGAADLAFWQSRGLNKGAAIYVSWDAAPVQSLWDEVDAYLRAYKGALRGYYKLGVYAGTPYLKHALGTGVVDYGWRPNAGSWSNDGLPYQPDTGSAVTRGVLLAQALKATPAHIWQTGNYWYNNQADENMVLRGPFGSHLGVDDGVDPIVQPPKPPVPKPSPTPVKPVVPKWPLPAGHYFGDINGPAVSHGGYNSWEKPYVRVIQQYMILGGWVPGIKDYNSAAGKGWCDGIYGQQTVDAVAKWQRAFFAAQTSRFGEVWSDDWSRLR